MDHIDRQIIMTLQRDARTPYAELARQVGLTAPAVADRTRKLEENGILRGYHANVDPSKAGRPLIALVRITVSGDETHSANLIDFAQDSSDIMELYRTAGTEDFVARVAVASVEALGQLVTSLARFGHTTTSVVLSSPVSWREVTL